MTQAQHTPGGKWRVVQCVMEVTKEQWQAMRGKSYMQSGDPTVWATGIACGHEIIVPHTLALKQDHARLIAAAPDLLAELVEEHAYWRNEMSAMYDLATGFSHEPERAKEYAARAVHAKIKAEKLAELIAKARGEA